MIRRILLSAAVLGVIAPLGAQTDEGAAARAHRWSQLQQAIFGDREVKDGSGVISLEAPDRALDAALVPVAMEMTGKHPVKSVYLIIDNNPGPLAAHVSFGPKADPRSLKLRVRVNAYTNMHAVAETQDGSLYAVETYVKAAGGCSAPAGADNEALLSQIGLMKLRPLGEFTPGEPLQAQLMIRHPNFNGLQMDQVTQHVTPARYLRSIDVTYQGEKVFRLESDISLSTDPVITFGFVPDGEGKLEVVALDTDGTTFSHSFELPAG